MIAALLLLLLLLPPLASSDIITTTFLNDSRPTINLRDFCFSEQGHVSIVLKNVSIMSKTPPNMSRIGLYLFEYYGVRPVDPGDVNCVSEDPYLFRDSFTPIASFNQLSGVPSSGFLNRTMKVPKYGKHAVFFSNCQNYSSVSANVELQVYNMNPDGTRDYLPHNLGYLPTDYFVASYFYLVLIIVWTYICYSNRRAFHNIHTAMGVLLVAKCLSLHFSGQNKLYESTNGTTRDDWDTVSIVFTAFRGLLFTTVVMLVGFGFSSLKPILDCCEKIVMALGITLQILVQTVYVFWRQIKPLMDNSSGLFWGFVFLDILSALIIILPFYASIISFKATAKADGTAVKTLKMMRSLQFGMFCTFVYLYISRFMKLMAVK